MVFNVDNLGRPWLRTQNVEHLCKSVLNIAKKVQKVIACGNKLLKLLSFLTPIVELVVESKKLDIVEHETWKILQSVLYCNRLATSPLVYRLYLV